MTLIMLDIETDGLYSHKNNILEVAAIAMDNTGREYIGHYSEVVHYTKEQMKAMFEQADEIVQDMHDANGLWEALSREDNGTLDQVLPDFLNWILDAQDIEEHRPLVVGDSVWFDVDFLYRNHVPFGQFFHYNYVDLSAVRQIHELASPAFHGIIGYRTKEERQKEIHRALGDCFEAFCKYLRWINFITKRETGLTEGQYEIIDELFRQLDLEHPQFEYLY